MKRANWLWVGCTVATVLYGYFFTEGIADATLTTNSWTASGNKWELGVNWSAGVPSLANAIDLVTGGAIPAGPRTITIDATTVASNAINGCMTVSNVTVGGINIAPDTLSLNNANNASGNNVMTILSGLTISSHGFMTITNSTLKVGLPGGYLIDDSFLTINTGSLIGTNASAYIGYTGSGQMTISGGTWLGNAVSVGNYGSAQGTLTIAGGAVTLQSTETSPAFLWIASAAGTAGTVWLTGGQLTVDDNTFSVIIGNGGTGQMTVSNGTWYGGSITVGAYGPGTLTLAGGTSILYEYLALADLVGNATGTVWMTGGELETTNNVTDVGVLGVGQMTMSNGIWLANAIWVGHVTGSQGTLTLAGGTTTFMNSTEEFFPNFLTIAGEAGTTGTLWMTGGQFTMTNATTLVGSNGVAQMTVSNGTWLARDVFVGFGPNSQGTLSVAGGTNLFTSILDVGRNTGMTGTVWMSGGELIVTNTGVAIALGDSGVAQMTISNGFCQTPALYVAYASSAQGTLSLAGGTLMVGQQGMILGNGPGNTGSVWMTQGRLITTNALTEVGAAGVGSLTMSNGTWDAGSVVVADFDDSEGTISAIGGVATMTNLVLGDCATGAEGFLVVKNGNVFITNATHTATLDVRNGWMFISGGQLVVDRVVMTNECGLFIQAGGTVSVGSVLLDPNLDADDDGLPNGWEIAHGLNPLSSAGKDGADGDPDGDGFTNLEEYEAGTDPQNPNSNPLKITSIVQQGNDILLTWTTAGGKTNRVQAATGVAGSYSNNFADVSPVIVPAGYDLTSASYLDVGGATNVPARYYRVRLVP